MLNTQRFLMYGGAILLLLALVGYIGLGPTANNSLFGSAFYLDQAENLGHLVAGVFALSVWKLAKTDRWLRTWSGILGVLALVVAVVGFLNFNVSTPNAGGANFELVDNIIHLGLALWGFWVAFMPEGPMFVRGDQESAKTS